MESAEYSVPAFPGELLERIAAASPPFPFEKWRVSSTMEGSFYALVAQLDRVSGYEPEGQRFESSPVR